MDVDPDDPRLIAVLRNVTDEKESRELTLAFSALIRAGANTLPGALGIMVARLIGIVAAKPESVEPLEGRYWMIIDPSRATLIFLAGCLFGYLIFSPSGQDVEAIARAKRLTAEHIQVSDYEGPDRGCFVTITGDRPLQKKEDYFDIDQGLVGQTVYWPPVGSPQH